MSSADLIERLKTSKDDSSQMDTSAEDDKDDKNDSTSSADTVSADETASSPYVPRNDFDSTDSYKINEEFTDK